MGGWAMEQRRDTADAIALRMQKEGHQVASLHGQQDSGARDATLDGFRDGRTKVLITTNVLARGIDIQQVNMVVKSVLSSSLPAVFLPSRGAFLSGADGV